jgi:hypothetical protein
MLQGSLATTGAFATSVCVIQPPVGGAAGSNGRGERLAGCGGRFIGFYVRSSFFKPPALIRGGEEWGAIFFGEVAEWSIAPVLKTGGPQGPVGSNPTLSAKIREADYLILWVG